MRILIIEDNRELALSIKKELVKHGFHVDVANTASDGVDKAFVNQYDIILLDLNLPDRDGLEVLKYLRKSDVQTPVIIITARDEIEQRAFGLDLGADDYLVKPFQVLELRARIQAVIRRFHGRTNPEIVIGSLMLNPLNRSAFYNDIPLVLKAKEFDILEYVASSHPAVVSSEEIAEHVYDENYDPFSSVLRVHIARLKNILKETAGREVLITLRGKGYYLCVEQTYKSVSSFFYSR